MPALVALLAGSAVGATAQDEAGPAGLVTELVEPGVERIIRDDAGHDLDEKHPTYRYDMDGIAITPDGTVWLRTTYSRSDNLAHPETSGPLVWALGEPDIYPVRYESPPTDGATYLYVRHDGTTTFTAVETVNSEDGPRWSEWWQERGQPTEMVGERLGRVLVARPDGDHACQNLGTSVSCQDPAGEVTEYLLGIPINQIADAPDGALWAVGGHDGDNGGLYRITLD